MKILVLGDIHKKWRRVESIVENELNDDDVALSTGDLETYRYNPKKIVPLYFVAGNHDHRWSIEKLLYEDSLLRPIVPGVVYDIGGLRVAGLSGVYSPYYYQNPQSHTKIHRHFSRQDVDSLMRINDGVDIFLSHDIPSGYGIRDGRDFGVLLLNAMVHNLKPRYYFFGHHHFFEMREQGKTTFVNLNKPNRCYGIIEDGTLNVYHSERKGPEEGYNYEWNRCLSS